MRLSAYLQVEARARKNSAGAFAGQLQLLDDLLDFYVRFLDLLKFEDRHYTLLGHFYLVVSDKLCGAASQLLNRRLLDSRALIRTAIEATSNARLIAGQPELREIFLNAYPNVADAGAPNQFKPTPKFIRTFTTGKTLAGEKAPWPFLRTQYAVNSIIGAHAGVGAFIGHATVEGGVNAVFMETDPDKILRDWHAAITTFKVILEIFFDLVRKCGPGEGISEIELQVGRWWDRASEQVRGAAAGGMERSSA
jgi:hypothetical protein